MSVNVPSSENIVGSLGSGADLANPGSDGGRDSGSSTASASETEREGEIAPNANHGDCWQIAVNLVAKIKSRFSYSVYSQICGLLKAGIFHTGSIAYSQIALLLEYQEDLIKEFIQFVLRTRRTNSDLPDTSQGTAMSNAISAVEQADNLAAAHRAVMHDHGTIVKKPLPEPNEPVLESNKDSSMNIKIRRQSASQQSSLNKPKMTSLQDVSAIEAENHTSLSEYGYFLKVRKALKNKEVYENFLRCLLLYNNEIMGRNEFILLVTPFLRKFPELFKYLKDFMDYEDDDEESNQNNDSSISKSMDNNNIIEGLSQQTVGIKEKNEIKLNQENLNAEIDFSTCKKIGTSYVVLPENYIQPECSGQTPLCKEVLNTSLASFPSFSEENTSATSKKTQYEEYVYRYEDERFEMDAVIESNLATIRVLETVKKKLIDMPPDEINKFNLDDCLGGTSAIIHQRSIRRIYGNKASRIIAVMKNDTKKALPIVLKRLKEKEEEWEEVRRQFNKIWHDKFRKYYLKSLDHRAIPFKQNDIKNLRSKSLLKEIELLHAKRQQHT